MSEPTDWITDEIIDPLAIAICYGGFHLALHRPAGGDAVAYWAGVAEFAKAEYREIARQLLTSVCHAGRFMSRDCPADALAKYMKTMRLANDTNARKHFTAMYDALPTIWGMSK